MRFYNTNLELEMVLENRVERMMKVVFEAIGVVISLWIIAGTLHIRIDLFVGMAANDGLTIWIHEMDFEFVDFTELIGRKDLDAVGGVPNIVSIAAFIVVVNSGKRFREYIVGGTRVCIRESISQ